MVIRYEDLHLNPRPNCIRLLEFMGVEISEPILTAMENADVVGSSFYGEDQKESARKPNWRPTARTDAFRPVGRWSHWGAVEKQLFKQMAGKELIELGYEKDLNW
jgi:hypothetical protein